MTMLHGIVIVIVVNDYADTDFFANIFAKMKTFVKLFCLSILGPR